MKNVLITGGAGGIGKGITKKFIDEGYFAYVLDYDKTALQSVKEQFGDNCRCLLLDVTNFKCLEETLSTLPNLNYVITLAGRALDNEWLPFEEQNYCDLEKSIKVNLLGHINTIKASLPLLKKANGDKAIVMISSINAKQGFGLPAYSAAKSGLYGFMNSTVKEFGNMGIRINTVSPGTVITEATEKEPKNFEELLKGSPLNKFATIENVSDVTFALCNIFDGITGEDIVIDCGQNKFR